jgi:hypothetical protein
MHWPHVLGNWPHGLGTWSHGLGNWPHGLGKWPHEFGNWPHGLGNWTHGLGNLPKTNHSRMCKLAFFVGKMMRGPGACRQNAHMVSRKDVAFCLQKFCRPKET